MGKRAGAGPPADEDGAVDIEFVRARGDSDWVHVRRDDGTTAKWPWVKAGGQLPHDLVHYLVETHFGLPDGFWELVAQGVDFGFLTAEADRIARGRPPQGLAGRDLTGLVVAECVVAGISTAVWTRADTDQTLAWVGQQCARRGQAVPAAVTGVAIPAVLHRIAAVTEQWHRLAEGGSLTFAYPATATPGPDEGRGAGAPAAPSSAGHRERRRAAAAGSATPGIGRAAGAAEAPGAPRRRP